MLELLTRAVWLREQSLRGARQSVLGPARLLKVRQRHSALVHLQRQIGWLLRKPRGRKGEAAARRTAAAAAALAQRPGPGGLGRPSLATAACRKRDGVELQGHYEAKIAEGIACCAWASASDGGMGMGHGCPRHGPHRHGLPFASGGPSRTDPGFRRAQGRWPLAGL